MSLWRPAPQDISSADHEVYLVKPLQDYSHLLEISYRFAHRALYPLRGFMNRNSWVERLVIAAERISKGAMFDCRMCGQCVLHSTGMTCPMTCPKNMRNGPCGGVLLNGNCEVAPDNPCVWAQAWMRSKNMPIYGKDIHQVIAPLNWQLKDSSAWINDFNEIAHPD